MILGFEALLDFLHQLPSSVVLVVDEMTLWKHSGHHIWQAIGKRSFASLPVITLTL